MRRGGMEYICGLETGSDPAPFSDYTEDIVVHPHFSTYILY